MKKFAIVTPVKDEIKYFPKTLQSILSQEIQPQKWIIIDDGSTDGTTELIKKAERENDWIYGIYRDPNEKKQPRLQTRDPIKTYRTQCYKDINGLLNCLGWDSIDELKANMLKWNSESFPELKIHHLRKTGSARGVFKGGIYKGIANYNSGSHPLYVLARALLILFFMRYKFNSVGLLWGYFSSMIKRKPKPIDKDLVKYIRRQQMNRLLGKKSIWK